MSATNETRAKKKHLNERTGYVGPGSLDVGKEQKRRNGRRALQQNGTFAPHRTITGGTRCETKMESKRKNAQPNET